MQDGINLGDKCEASAILNSPNNQEGISFDGVFHVECRDKDGNLKWCDKIGNLVVNQGLNYALDALFDHDSSPVTQWYVGLTAASPTPAAGDTPSSHGGWTEFTDYDEATRQDLIMAITTVSATNSANRASFTVNQDSSSVGGCFIISESTKSGVAGILLSVGAFSGGNKAADNTDVLNVTYTLTAADA